jgi:cyclopropane fatty-acyl-phospholipid synthase-like methyltransferase
MDHPSEWWQSFFSGPVVDFVLDSRDRQTTRDEADFIEQSLGIQPGDKLLDVPCGGGRLAMELAGRGYQVTGLDLCAELLQSAGRQASERNLDINWITGDMRELSWRGEFDAAYCFWSSFGYFDEAENAAFLKAVSRSLKPGATFLLDTPLIETRLPEMEAQERVWWPVGNLLALEERNFDHRTSRVESEWTFVRDGQTERKFLSLRLYTYRELSLLLDQAGFGNLQAYGSLDWDPFGLGSTWLYLVATKLTGPS